MTRKEVQKLSHGLYLLHWKDGGGSVAAVGSNFEGKRWFAATNWISGVSFDWRKVAFAEFLTDQDTELRIRGIER